ncbi:MAG: chemotaxis protein CheW [Deltaproteobacteria bacterium]|nr:chemotaxis protein CheW [Deltaproteobacteria bacterium]
MKQGETPSRRGLDWAEIRERLLREQAGLEVARSAAELEHELKARATTLARTERASTEGLDRQHLAFWIGQARCAVDLALVGGVVTPRWVTPLPTAPRRLSRVIQVQGTIVPVADLIEVLGVKPHDQTSTKRAVLLSLGSRHLALLTHRAEEIIRLDPDRLSSPGRDASGFIRGLAPDLTLVLDGEALLSSLTAGPLM